VSALSFSSAVKNELCRVETDRSSSLFELAAAARISGLIKVVNANEINLRLVTENAAFARRIFSQIKDLYGINAEISIRRSPKLKKNIVYIIVLTSSKGLMRILEDINIKVSEKVEYIPYARCMRKKEYRKAYLRGAFLASGSMSDPEKTYHLEITCHNMALATELHSKVTKREHS